MRHALAIGAFALTIVASSAIAKAETTTTPNDQYSQSAYAQTAAVQPVSPDVAEWTAHLVITSPTQHQNGIGRFAGGVLARTSKLAQQLTRSALRFLGTPYVFGG
ncbi:MAG TPA: hypothetical protein VK760_08970, partial [Candidatus Acidoferrales bacterium]|nr:hypothetical protein [Candidatus Acidoferrales bacterium]